MAQYTHRSWFAAWWNKSTDLFSNCILISLQRSHDAFIDCCYKYIEASLGFLFFFWKVGWDLHPGDLCSNPCWTMMPFVIVLSKSYCLNLTSFLNQRGNLSIYAALSFPLEKNRIKIWTKKTDKLYWRSSGHVELNYDCENWTLMISKLWAERAIMSSSPTVLNTL